MAKAVLEINDKFTFVWNKITAGSEEQKRKIPEFVRYFFEKNVTSRSELLGDEFLDRYVLKWYEGDTRVDNPRPVHILSLRHEKYRADPNIDPLFLVEVELSYGDGKNGGIGYRPLYSKDSKLEVKLLEILEDNENETHYSFQITGSLFWDYKTSSYKEHVRVVESKGICSWDDVPFHLRINIRDNYEVKKIFRFDEKGYKLPHQPIETIDNKIVGKPEDESNLCFTLEMTPNVFSIVADGKSPYDKKYDTIQDKNIHMKCKYLNF